MGLGDYTPGKSVVFNFNTHKADGTPITLAGTPALSVYKNSTTESTSGVTLTVDYDSRTGMHHVVIDTSSDGTFYAAGNDFNVVITTGTVDSVSVVGTVVGAFSLSNRSALRPTTADRTLDVSSGGEAGLDWANVGSPTTTLNLSGTTVKTLTDAVTLPTIPSNWIAAAGIASGAITAAKFAADAIDSNALAASAVTEIHASDADTSGVTTLLSRLSSARAGYLDNINNSALQTTVAQTGDSYARLGAPAGASIAADLVVIDDFVDALESRLTAARAGYLDNINNAALAALTDSSIADQVWDEILSGHAVSGSTGEALSAAGGAGDPWITALPGSYTAGQAGYILGTNLNALISSRMASYTQPTGFLTATFPGTVASTTNITAAAGCAVSSIATDAINSNSLANSAVSEIQSGLSTLDAAGVRTALGLASANLDTQLSGIPAAVFASTVETGVSFMQCVRALGAMAGGKRSNAGTISEQVDALGNPGTARMVSNLDESANGTPTLTLGA